MSTSAENGDIVTLAVTLASATVVAIAAQDDFSISRTAAEIDTPTKGDTSTPCMPGIQKVTVSCSGLYVHTDEGQLRLKALMQSNTQITLEILRNGSAYESATANITSLEQVFTRQSAATYSAEFAIDGDFA